MTEFYFVIRTSEDGDVSMHRFTKVELEERLNDDYWGPDVKINHEAGVLLSHGMDIDGVSGIYIIKGSLVEPKQETVVTKWRV